MTIECDILIAAGGIRSERIDRNVFAKRIQTIQIAANLTGMIVFYPADTDKFVFLKKYFQKRFRILGRTITALFVSGITTGTGTPVVIV